MRALLDEQVAAEIARQLRRRGHDVDAVTERSDLRGAPDEDLMVAAAREDRAIITNNIRHFRPIPAERLTQGEHHAGLILLPSTRTRNRAAVEWLVSAVHLIMTDNPTGIHDSERWIAPLH